MNYSPPVNRTLSEDEEKNKKFQLDDILTQQIYISQLSNGITFTDTENMDSYERNYILQKLLQMKKEENDAKQKAMDNARKGNKR